MKVGLNRLNWVKFSKKHYIYIINNKIKNTRYEKKN